MAHELGHALHLGHPRQQAFWDGTPHNVSGQPNVMEGGADCNGGGGEHLEDWQICMARAAAEEFWKEQQKGDDLISRQAVAESD